MARSTSPATSSGSARVRLILAAVTAGIPVAKELWSVINQDDRAVRAVRDGAAGARRGVVRRTPAGRVETTLDAIDDFAGDSEHPEAAGWTSESEAIRARLSLVRLQKGRDRRTGVKDLQGRATALLERIVTTTA